MAAVAGFEAKLYRNTGTYESPTWDLVENVKDVTLNVEAAEAEVTTRASNGWKVTLTTIKEASLDFEMVWDTADADFTAVKNAFFNRTQIDMAIMDGDITVAGSQGLRASMGIKKFSRSEALAEALTVSVTALPGPSAHPPEWLIVT